MRKQTGHKQGEGITLNNIGLVYNMLGKDSEALESHQKVLAIRKQINDKAGEGVTLNNIGLTYSNLGQYPQALEFFQQALAIRKQVGDKAGEGITLNNIGYVLMQTGKLKEATKTLHTAIEVQELLRPELKDTDKVSIIDTQRNSYRFLQQAYIVQKQYQEALEISERGRARAFAELLAEKQKTQIEPKPTIKQLKQIAKEETPFLGIFAIASLRFVKFLINFTRESRF
ncbi:MAG: tetratricopeptide repeat protein [Nostoc sp.]|uniref:tetratricopeptide repeat protein n=1 Tax=Nostoc sp. TaxID=1180 RepID=UPI002FF679BE